MAKKSRAEYFRKRRETRRQFIVWLDKEFLERVNQQMKDKGITRTDWLKKKLVEEFGK